MTWLGEIGKIYRDSVENLRENMNLRSKFCVCVSILDAATDLSGCSHSGSLSSEMFVTVLDSLTKLLVPPCDPEFGGYNIWDVKTMIIYVCFFILNLQLLSYGCLSNFNISCPGGGL